MKKFYRLKRNDTRWKFRSSDTVKNMANGKYLDKFKKLFYYFL